MDPEPKYASVCATFHADICLPPTTRPECIYKNNKIVVVDNVLTQTECDQLREIFDAAVPSVSLTRTSSLSRVKKCIQLPALTECVQSRIQEWIPGTVEKGNWEFVQMQEAWRFVSCAPGSKLQPHIDATFVKSLHSVSHFTVMLYLTDNEDGAISFEPSPNLDILPKRGRVVLFHQSLYHCGKVNTHPKFFLRNELMYTPVAPELCNYTKADYEALELYQKATTDEEVECAFQLSPKLESLALGMFSGGG